MEYPMLIDGAEVRTSNRRIIRLPYDESEVATVFEAGPAEVDAAVAAAHRAADMMRELSREERAAILRKAHALLAQNRDDMALAISSECGKPVVEARAEVDRGSQTLLFAAEEAHRMAGEVVPMDAAPAGKGRWGMTVREPIGVIAAITPFNFPLNLSLHKIAPAIAAGNAVVHKPASTTPVSALKMAALFAQCGLPKGALNVITGPGGTIGELLVKHDLVAMLTFTGSVDVGLRLRSLAGMKRVTLELGSNSAVIIDEDADLDKAVARATTGSFAHSGQVCISVQRIYAHESVHRQFSDALADAARKLRVGHPHDEATQISSLITQPDAERVVDWVQEGVRAGAKLLTGGERSRSTVSPVVLTNVPRDSPLISREVFGPVVSVNAHRSLDEAIDEVNGTDYGLQAGMFTRNLDRAFYAARKVRVGGFLINEVPQFRLDHMPYGGVKMSGTGREGPKYAIEEMTELKLISW